MNRTTSWRCCAPLDGQILVSLSSTPAAWIGPAIHGPAKGHPRLQFHTARGYTRAEVGALLDGRKDLALTGRRSLDPRLEHRHLVADQPVVALTHLDSLVSRRHVSLVGLAAERFVVLGHRSGTQAVFVEALDAVGVSWTWPEGSVLVDGVSTLLHAIRVGVGVAIVTELPCDGVARYGDMDSELPFRCGGQRVAAAG